MSRTSSTSRSRPITHHAKRRASVENVSTLHHLLFGCDTKATTLTYILRGTPPVGSCPSQRLPDSQKAELDHPCPTLSHRALRTIVRCEFAAAALCWRARVPADRQLICWWERRDPRAEWRRYQTLQPGHGRRVVHHRYFAQAALRVRLRCQRRRCLERRFGRRKRRLGHREQRFGRRERRTERQRRRLLLQIEVS